MWFGFTNGVVEGLALRWARFSGIALAVDGLSRLRFSCSRDFCFALTVISAGFVST